MGNGPPSFMPDHPNPPSFVPDHPIPPSWSQGYSDPPFWAEQMSNQMRPAARSPGSPSSRFTGSASPNIDRGTSSDRQRYGRSISAASRSDTGRSQSSVLSSLSNPSPTPRFQPPSVFKSFIHTKCFEGLGGETLDHALSHSKTEISPWVDYSGWVHADINHVKTIVGEVSTLGPMAEIQQPNFLEYKMIYPVSESLVECQLSAHVGLANHYLCFLASDVLHR